jgi:tetratricopeptide (TPR) repeat protein
MTKDKVLFGVLGLIVGIAIGFLGANSLNRAALDSRPASAASNSATSPGSNPALPPDHPPLGVSGGGDQQPGGGGVPEVMAAIEKAKQKPDDFEAQMTAADLYYQIQRFDEAAVYYEKANKLKPAEREPLVKLGNALFDSEKYPEAEKWYLAALQKDPKDINVRTDLGLTFFLREPRDLDRAIKEYQASLAIDPEHEVTLQNLALAYREKNDEANLQATLERIRKINPDNPLLKPAAQ